MPWWGVFGEAGSVIGVQIRKQYAAEASTLTPQTCQDLRGTIVWEAGWLHIPEFSHCCCRGRIIYFWRNTDQTLYRNWNYIKLRKDYKKVESRSAQDETEAHDCTQSACELDEPTGRQCVGRPLLVRRKSGMARVGLFSSIFRAPERCGRGGIFCHDRLPVSGGVASERQMERGYFTKSCRR